MPNMRMDKNPMPEQCPNVRNKNFLEVTTGYTEEMAIDEAQRCLNCKHKPCMQGCPVSVKIPEFIAFVAKGEFENAYKKIKETNALPAVCGRVCPQEKQCESKCVRGIKGESVGIGRLERFVADWHMKNVKEEIEKPVSNGKRVAVVGSGPSGLTVAGDLAKKGYEVTIYEAFHTAGGVLMYGIPEFRLPKDIVQKEISNLKEMGVDIETNVVIGKTLTVDELFDEMNFDAVYIGSGAGLPHFMGIEGESLNGVYSANEFLTRINLMKGYKFPEYDTPVYVGKNVAVLGGGNVAMDAARSAKRLGAENVYIVYRRGKEELPARAEEVFHAEEEGIEFKLLQNPTKILGNEDGWVNGMEVIKMELGEPDDSGRRRPVPIEGSEEIIDVDTVVVAIGQTPNPLIRKTTKGLDTNKRGCIIADEETGKTSKDHVYAGGEDSFEETLELPKVFLEIKKKYRGLVNKRRTTLELGEAYDFIETGVKPELQDYMNGQVLNELEYCLNLYDLEPKVYIAYDRLAYFEKGNDDLRISFDTNIRTRRSDLLLESGDHGKRLLDSDVWLMEIKTSLAKPLWLCEMLSEFEICSSSFSKYGTEYKNMIARQKEMPKQKIFVFGNQKQAV